MSSENKTSVAVVMGSDSDMAVMQSCIDQLSEFGIKPAIRIISAHRTAQVASEFAEDAAKNGIKVIIAAAGMAAHLAGALAAEANLVHQYCAEEILRAMTPDLSIARRWKLDLEGVDKLIGQTKAALKAGHGAEAETCAKQSRLALEEAMADDSAFASVRNTLDEARVFLSEAQYMIMGHKQENLTKPAAATKDIYDSFLKLGHEFSATMRAFIAGQTEGLAPKAEELRMSAREHLLSATASMRKAIETE